jgi:Smg protein
MFDILVYLFENCQKTDLSQHSALVARKLSAAGFEDSDISGTLAWLAGVLRAFAPRECAKLDTGCRGFLIYLEHTCVIDPGLRELVIDRALSASTQSLTLDQLKLIVLMVLWNEKTPTGQLIAEDLLSDDVQRLSH